LLKAEVWMKKLLRIDADNFAVMVDSIYCFWVYRQKKKSAFEALLSKIDT